jgi:hypothetical protein
MSVSMSNANQKGKEVLASAKLSSADQKKAKALLDEAPRFRQPRRVHEEGARGAEPSRQKVISITWALGNATLTN